MIFRRARDARNVHARKFAILTTDSKSLAPKTLELTYNMHFSRKLTIYVRVRAQRARKIKFWSQI